MNMHGVDTQFLTKLTKEFIEVPSPVGYYPKTQKLLEHKAAEYGYEVEWDNKHTGYIKLEGEDTSKTVMLTAHLDTLGLIVRGFNADGTLRIRKLGGVNYHSLEGTTCKVICRDGSYVDGMVICNKHSVHVFEDARSVERDENNMSVMLTADVKSEADARALGITEGAIVDIDPDFVSYDNGYIISRYIDDKACVASLFGVLEYLRTSGKKPRYNTWLSFPIYEEIGHGNAYVPEEVDELVAVDIALYGPDYSGDEHEVGIIVADAVGPYDWNLSNTLIDCAKRADCNYNIQVAFHFSTDAMSAYSKGANVASAAFGPVTSSTHGRERTHADALLETAKLAIAYVCDVD